LYSIPCSLINIDFNVHNYPDDRRKISIIFGTFLFVDLKYGIIQRKHYPASEVKLSVSSVCLRYGRCMRNGYAACLICPNILIRPLRTPILQRCDVRLTLIWNVYDEYPMYFWLRMQAYENTLTYVDAIPYRWLHIYKIKYFCVLLLEWPSV